MDLGSFASIRAAAARFVATSDRLDVLVNNAGQAGARGLTVEGFEPAFGINHLGPFLFTRLLEPLLRASAPSRVVNVASRAHKRVSGVDFAAVRKPPRTPTAFPEYSVSKLCNVLFTREAARRWADAGICVVSLHPGVVASEIWRRVPGPARWVMKRFMLTVEEGARTSIFCATDPGVAAQSGAYFDREKVVAPSAVAQDDALALRLWDESERFCGDALAPLGGELRATQGEGR